MKVFPLEKLVEGGASEQAKREVTKRCDICAKCSLLFDGFLSVRQRTRNESLDNVADAEALCDTKVSRVRMSCRQSTGVPAGPSRLL
jgi:hypothetical protein